MNCDQTIDVILDGKLPSNQQMLAHLAVCKRCQSLVEVMQPVMVSQLEVARASGVSEFFSCDLEPSDGAISIAEDSAAQLGRSSSAGRKSLVQLKYAVAFFAGVAASLGGIAVIHSEPAQSPAIPQTACLWESEFDQTEDQEDFVKSCVACHLVSAY